MLGSDTIAKRKWEGECATAISVLNTSIGLATVGEHIDEERFSSQKNNKLFQLAKALINQACQAIEVAALEAQHQGKSGGVSADFEGERTILGQDFALEVGIDVETDSVAPEGYEKPESGDEESGKEDGNEEGKDEPKEDDNETKE